MRKQYSFAFNCWNHSHLCVDLVYSSCLTAMDSNICYLGNIFRWYFLSNTFYLDDIVYVVSSLFTMSRNNKINVRNILISGLLHLKCNCGRSFHSFLPFCTHTTHIHSLKNLLLCSFLYHPWKTNPVRPVGIALKW